MSEIHALSTPAAAWRQVGDPDPHAGNYDCERAKLVMGHLTDDELANGAFLNYDRPLNVQGILAGTHLPPIAWMTAVKDRIRWLSRALAAAEAERDGLARALDRQTTAAEQIAQQVMAATSRGQPADLVVPFEYDEDATLRKLGLRPRPPKD